MHQNPSSMEMLPEQFILAVTEETEREENDGT